MIRRCLTFRNNLNACPTAASSAEYGFCSVLGPSVMLKVSSLGHHASTVGCGRPLPSLPCCFARSYSRRSALPIPSPSAPSRFRPPWCPLAPPMAPTRTDRRFRGSPRGCPRADLPPGSPELAHPGSDVAERIGLRQSVDVRPVGKPFFALLVQEAASVLKVCVRSVDVSVLHAGWNGSLRATVGRCYRNRAQRFALPETT